MKKLMNDEAKKMKDTVLKKAKAEAKKETAKKEKKEKAPKEKKVKKEKKNKEKIDFALGEDPRNSSTPTIYFVKATKDGKIKPEDKRAEHDLPILFTSLDTFNALTGDGIEDNPAIKEDYLKSSYTLTYLPKFRAMVLSSDYVGGMQINADLEILHALLDSGFEVPMGILGKINPSFFQAKWKGGENKKSTSEPANTAEHDVLKDTVDRAEVKLEEIPLYTLFIYAGNVFFKFRKTGTAYLVSPLKETGEFKPGMTFVEYLSEYHEFNRKAGTINDIMVSPCIPEFITEFDNGSTISSGCPNAICAEDDDDEDEEDSGEIKTDHIIDCTRMMHDGMTDEIDDDDDDELDD